jgi:hypothetical protein
LTPDFLKAFVCCALVFVSCDGNTSGDVGNNPSGGASVTKDQLIARIDAICTSGRDQLRDLEAPRNLGETPKFLRRVLPVIRDQVKEIRALGEAPKEDRGIYLEWFAARDGIVETTALMIKAAEEGDRDEFNRYAALQSQLDSQADDAAKRYGFEVCGASTEPAPAPTPGG